MLRFFGFSIFFTVASILVALFGLGPAAAVTTVILIAIEVAFSFDNAIINAKVLERLSKFWQQLFLTIGMVVAIVGMRFVFPILIVMITADLGWKQVIDDALHHPKVYGEHLAEAHHAISAFGGSFLLVLALYFLFDDDRPERWLKRLEKWLQKEGGTVWGPPVLAAVIIVIFSRIVGGEEGATVLRAGLLGAFSYTALKLMIDVLGKLAPKKEKIYTGWAAFMAFMYLQVLDASFSFDGVLGAFAITDQVLLIALGLGVGALWVRSLTVYLVRKGTLGMYIYLEHGAHYAILVLAAALLGSLFYEVPDALTGVVGIGVIAASFYSSSLALKAKQSKTH
jgi:hypothetical protein